MAKNTNMIGKWAFLIGVILALIFGLFQFTSAWAIWALVIIGLLVGILNISSEESMPFLMSGVALIIATSLSGGVMSSIATLGRMLEALLLVFVPAVIIVAIRNVFGMAKY